MATAPPAAARRRLIRECGGSRRIPRGRRRATATSGCRSRTAARCAPRAGRTSRPARNARTWTSRMASSARHRAAGIGPIEHEQSRRHDQQTVASRRAKGGWRVSSGDMVRGCTDIGPINTRGRPRRVGRFGPDPWVNSVEDELTLQCPDSEVRKHLRQALMQTSGSGTAFPTNADRAVSPALTKSCDHEPGRQQRIACHVDRDGAATFTADD